MLQVIFSKIVVFVDDKLFDMLPNFDTEFTIQFLLKEAFSKLFEMSLQAIVPVILSIHAIPKSR